LIVLRLMGLAVLLALVAMASRQPLGSYGGGSATGELRVPLSALVVLAGVGLILVVVVLAFARGLFVRRDSDELVPIGPPVPARGAAPFLALLVPLAVGAVFVVGTLQGVQSRSLSVLNAPRRVAPVAASRVGGGRVDGGAGLELPSWTIVAAAALAVLGTGAAVLSLRAPRAGTSAQRTHRHAPSLATALDASIDDLLGDPSARRAVIRAYASMEGALARHGVARRAAEAPREYLARALAAFGASGHVAGSLTGLFEEARFSRHDVGEGMRRDAIDALVQLRGELGESG
jgi:hypothetical protein